MIREVDTIVLGGGLIGHLVGVLFPGAFILDRRPAPAAGMDVTHQPGAHYLWAPLRGLTNSRITVHTRIDGKDATPESIAAYKKKVMEPMPSAVRENGEPSYRLQQFTPVMDGWRAQLPHVPVCWNQHVAQIDAVNHVVSCASDEHYRYKRLINTIPLNALLRTLTVWPQLELVNRPVWVATAHTTPCAHGFVEPDALHVNYVTDPVLPWYRETYQNDGTVQRESLRAYVSGMFQVLPGKLVAHPEVPHAIDELRSWDIYTFGHYGTWDPDELTHHTWAKLLVWSGLSTAKEAQS
jgi:hypothetical protein